MLNVDLNSAAQVWCIAAKTAYIWKPFPTTFGDVKLHQHYRTHYATTAYIWKPFPTTFGDV